MPPSRFAALLLLCLAASQAEGRGGVAPDRLAQAARTTVLSAIDPNETQCGSERTVERWLQDLARREVRTVTWSGGACRLRRPEVARDSGGEWCGQATIELRRPRFSSDRPMVEIYFEAPSSGRPGKPYAFRGVLETAGGLDYTRFSSDFEAAWTERFRVGEPSGPGCR